MELKDIHNPLFLKNMKVSQLSSFCDEIRKSIIEHTSVNGGHLSYNMASVEILTALNYLLNPIDDLIVIGNDNYTDNVLHGNYEHMNVKRYDSLSTGFAKSLIRDFENDDRNVVIYINSDCINDPFNLEMLNQISLYDKKIIIVYNEVCDEKRSVNILKRSVSTLGNTKTYNSFKSSIKNVLRSLKNGEDIIETIHKTKSSIKKNLINEGIFEEYDIDYIGPVDGHSISSIIFNMKSALTKEYPVVVHCVSILNKDLPEKYNQLRNYAYVEPFNINDGRRLIEESNTFLYARNIVSKNLETMMKDDKDIICISSNKYSQYSLGNIKAQYPDRFISLNVSSNNLLSLSAELSDKRKVYLSMKCSDLIDNLKEFKDNISKLNTPLLIGLLKDSELDESVFDLLKDVIIYYCKNANDIRNIMNTAFSYNKPCLFIYPNTCIYYYEKSEIKAIELGKMQKIVNNDMKDKCVLAHGDDIDMLKDVIVKNELKCDLYDISFINPFDCDTLDIIFSNYKHIYSYNNIVDERLKNFFNSNHFKADLSFINKDELNTIFQ